jgi:hypothetical protein
MQAGHGAMEGQSSFDMLLCCGVAPACPCVAKVWKVATARCTTCAYYPKLAQVSPPPLVEVFFFVQTHHGLTSICIKVQGGSQLEFRTQCVYCVVEP